MSLNNGETFVWMPANIQAFYPSITGYVHAGKPYIVERKPAHGHTTKVTWTHEDQEEALV